MKNEIIMGARRLWKSVVVMGCLGLLWFSTAGAQMEQRIDVVIKDFTFHTQQVPLQLGIPTVITISNQDKERHDFGSRIFQGTLTHVESGGVTYYGKGMEGLFLDPDKDATIRFMIERPGKYEFRCSIHPRMKGEIWLMNVGAV